MPKLQERDEAVLDISNEICPMTFVRTRLALDRIAPGDVLAVKLRGIEPIANVPRSAREHGHEILSQQEIGDGTVLLRLRRGPNPAA